jgi:hypothetical protein
MNKNEVLTKLDQLLGHLKPAQGVTGDDLKTLHRKIAEQLTQHPELNISGNRAHHETAPQFESVEEPFDRFSHLDDLFERTSPVGESTTSPLIFRRETAFRNTFVGNSVAAWGSGLAATESFGPFIDEHGLQVWFDFFWSVKTVKVYIKGRSTPVLLLPVRGSITARKSYRIEAGSVWIASDCIARTSALTGYYTGLRVSGGTLDLSENAEVAGAQITINPSVTAILKLDLNQNVVTSPSSDAGFDATDAVIQLPGTFTLSFNASNSTVAPSDAACTVFGCETQFHFENLTPIWISFLGQVLIPYSVKSNGDLPETFQVNSSSSKLCSASKSAEINTGSGWLLPAANVDPAYLGEASGTGSLCISLLKGLNATWKGLKGTTHLNRPAIIAEPGMVTLIDFFAENTYGKQNWTLWKNSATKHHSQIALGFGKVFPFVFVTESKGSEAVFYFCNHKAAFDRPVDVNGTPFKIESSIALAGILQTGAIFRAFLLDNDLLFDGNPNDADAYKRYSIALRNAVFSVSPPYSLFLSGELTNEDQITNGVVALTYGVHFYLPTLPDPYVASYGLSLRESASFEFARLTVALAAFVKWPKTAEKEQAHEIADDPAYVYFKFVPLNQSLLSESALSTVDPSTRVQTGEQPATNVFQAGVRTFDRVLGSQNDTNTRLPLIVSEQEIELEPSTTSVASAVNIGEQIRGSIKTAEIKSVVSGLETDPLLAHIKDKTLQVEQTLNAAMRASGRTASSDLFETGVAAEQSKMMATSSSRGKWLARDIFMLLDVSSKADQMGVSFGAAIQVDRDQHGETNLHAADVTFSFATSAGGDLPLQILNMDVVASARYVRAVTLPQISWEPVSNIPLAIEGPPDPQDLVTVAPGILVYENDGIPTRIYSESPYPVPITPLSVTRHFVKEFNDKKVPRQLYSMFTLPFALIAHANFQRSTKLSPDKNSQIHFNTPWFNQVHGGLQIKALPPSSFSTSKKPSFSGWTVQLDNIKWFLFGIPITGSTLGATVKTIFNNEFFTNKPKVPLEKIEFSGYGATIFSNWFDRDAAIAEVSQAKFDVLVGRTAHEVVQVRSILYPFGVHVVRTITLMRSANGYVFRSDSGWKAESDGFYDFDYKINFDTGPLISVDNPYEFHPGIVKGVSNVREIMDYPAGGKFTSSFKLNDPDQPLPVRSLSLADWQKLFKNVTSLNDDLKVEMEAVVFDADVHMDAVTSGGIKDETYGDFKVQSRKVLGYVQLAPSAILVPAHTFAELLKSQNGSLGGPVDCIIDVANSKQKMRLTRMDVNPALDNSGKNIFVSAARGSVILPPDGSWSVVKHQTDTGDVKPVEEGQTVPVIKPNGDPIFRIANPADITKQDTSKINFGVLQSTGTQKLLFDIPQFTNGVQKLLSSETYFADAYKLLNSKGVFPNVANALGLTNAEKEVEILGEGLMKMAERNIDLNSLLPSNYQYAFIDEPGILRIYAEYKSTDNAAGKLKLGIDSAGAFADKWKAALSNIRVVVDLGPFDHLMWVDGNFNASNGLAPKYDKPNLQFGPVLQPVIDILQVLATLSGDDFDQGMDVGMSNSPDNWEYKFNCSKEIPVIKFPSPEQLTINPNPPLKLEAGLKVGFYFNEVISIPTDLKQLVPACGAYVEFQGGLEVQCFTLAVASVYAVGQVTLGIAADTKAGISLHMKFGFGVEIVVGLPVVGNVSVLYMVEIEVGISEKALDVGALMLFRGSVEICGGLVAICIQIEAGGAIHRDLPDGPTSCIAQVTFTIDVTVLWVIDIDESDSWQESRQIA